MFFNMIVGFWNYYITYKSKALIEKILFVPAF